MKSFVKNVLIFSKLITFSHTEAAEIWTVSEKVSWDMANRGKTLDLVWKFEWKLAKSYENVKDLIFPGWWLYRFYPKCIWINAEKRLDPASEMKIFVLKIEGKDPSY
jgi:hypothetical protein